MKKFILSGNGPCLNRGCEAILRSTLEILNTEFPDSSFLSCPCLDARIKDEEIIKAGNLSHKPFTSGAMTLRRRIISRLKSYAGIFPACPFAKDLEDVDAVLNVGGDTLSLEYGVRSAKMRFDVDRYVLSRGKPLVVWGATIGPFSMNPNFEHYAIERLKSASLITVRDPLTVEYLASHGVSENVVKVADPAFAMHSEAPQHINTQDYGLHEEPIGLNLSPLIGQYLGKNFWFDKAVEALKSIDAITDRPIVLVPHVVWEMSNDYDFLSAIKERLGKSKNKITILPSTLNATHLKWCLGKMSLFAGARTHATIGSLSQAVPTISIGYSMKSRGINLDIFGHDRWVLDSKHLNAVTIAQKIQELTDHSGDVQKHLQKYMPEYTSQSYAGAVALRRLLEDRNGSHVTA